jgi:hypothetical protein
MSSAMITTMFGRGAARPCVANNNHPQQANKLARKNRPPDRFRIFVPAPPNAPPIGLHACDRRALQVNRAVTPKQSNQKTGLSAKRLKTIQPHVTDPQADRSLG